MNQQDLLSELEKLHPNRNIIVSGAEGQEFYEVIVELEPTNDHSDYSTALVVVGRSQPHFHKQITEVYEVVKGRLTVTIDDQKHQLSGKDTITIKPGQIHSAEGHNAWFLTHSKPGWQASDHYLA